MAAIGLRGAFAYGAKYLASLAVVLAVGGAIAGGGWYLALLAGASPLAPTVAALTTPQVAAGIALTLLGALVTAAGLVGMAFKLLADAATVGVDEALAGAAATEVVDAAAPTEDVENGSESTPGDATAETAEDDVGERPGDETDTEPDRPTDERASPTTDEPAEPSSAQPDGRVYRPEDDGSEPGSAAAVAEDGQIPPSTASGRDHGTERAESTDGPPSESADAAPERDVESPSDPATRGRGGDPHRSEVLPGKTDGTEGGADRTDSASATEGSGSDGPSSDAVVERAGAAVADAIEFDELSDDGSESPAAAASRQTGAVPDRETRIEPAGRSGEGGDAEHDSTEDAASDDASGSGVVDEHDTTAEEWTPPDPDEFERETGTGGGSGRNGDPDAAAGGDVGSTGADSVSTGSGDPVDVEDDASTADPTEDEDLTLADEGVDTVDVSGDGDPLADRLPGGDG